MKPILAMLVMAAALATASAQRTPPTPAQMAQHEVEHYTEMLSLTSDQQTQATAIATAAATSAAGLRDSERTAHQALTAAIVSGDTAAITQAANTLGQIEAESTSTRAQAEAKLYKILTPDQQTKFAQMLERPMHRGPGGPGGPGGPPPAE